MTEQTPSHKSEQLAQALLLEQVAFYKHQLTTQLSAEFFQQFIQLFLQNAPNILLKEVIELEQIQAVVRRYAFEMQLGAGLLELIGEIAKRVHIFAIHSPAKLIDVFSDQQFDIWLAKLLELENIRHYLNRFFKESPSTQQFCQYIATTTLHNRLPKFFQHVDEDAAGLLNKFEWSHKLKNFSQRQQQRLEQKLEDHIAQFIQEQLAELTLVSNDDLEALVRNVWEDHKNKALSEYTTQVSSLDVEEFFVMLYEYWKELRQSSFIQDLILYGVKVFYDFYQDESLEEVFAAIGLEESDLQNEAVRFYPKVVKALDEHEMLEPIIQLILKPFYQSTQTLATIEKYL